MVQNEFICMLAMNITWEIYTVSPLKAPWVFKKKKKKKKKKREKGGVQKNR